MDTFHQPLACTLSSVDVANQGTEWADLRANALASDPIDGGAVMTFPVGMADIVEDLARRERSCCSFLTITTKNDRDGVRLEITSDHPNAKPVIEAFTGVGRP
ncbi:MAG: hypothetical protein U9N56_00695 [Actinomycetota bacterium]|nr:hypothetical protein [Actinomycetota bacterium]